MIEFLIKLTNFITIGLVSIFILTMLVILFYGFEDIIHGKNFTTYVVIFFISFGLIVLYILFSRVFISSLLSLNKKIKLKKYYQELELEQSKLILLFTETFIEHYPNLHDFMSTAVFDPKKWLSTYHKGMKIDGVNIDACFTENMKKNDVELYNLFFETYVAHGLVGAVDWKEQYIEIEYSIDKMIVLNKLHKVDWSQFDNQDKDKLMPNEYLSNIANSVNFGEYCLVDIDFSEDMYVFSLIHNKHMSKIDTMLNVTGNFSVKRY